MEKTTKVMALVAIQLVLVAGLFGVRGFTVLTGEEIILETEPVDPRDIFRGDYATLSYAISTLPAPSDDWEAGDRAYVVLEQQGTYHQPVSVHHERPPTSGGQVCLQGQVQWVDARGEGGPQNGAEDPRLNIEYGIESYFIPEGAGDPPRDARVDAQVAVDRFCHAVITAILVDGEPWDPERNQGR